MDVAYCSLDIRYLGMDKVADRFVGGYREASGDPLPNLALWEAVGSVPADARHRDLGSGLDGHGPTHDRGSGRDRYSDILSSFLQRTA